MSSRNPLARTVTVKCLALHFAAFVLVSFSQQSAAQQPAFPSAFGAGAYSTGGRGGAVLHVTNLNDSGEGSFREALASDESPRYIIFDVSGAIFLESPIGGVAGNFTVDGNSAPYGGITLRGHALRPTSTDNQIWKNIRFRNCSISGFTGSLSNETCLATRNSIGVMVDHCSFAFARSKGFSNYSGSGVDDDGGNVTVQNSLFGESSQMALIGGRDTSNNEFSFLRNMSSQVGYRTPNLGGSNHADIINNYIYNWSGRLSSFYYRDFTTNMIGNNYVSGLNTDQNEAGSGNLHKVRSEDGMNPSLYLNDNFISEERRPMSFPAQPETAFGLYSGSPADVIEASWFVDERLPFVGREIPLLQASEVKEALLPYVGASRYMADDGTLQFYRDSIDEELVAIVEEDRVVPQIRSSEYPVLATDLPSETRPAGFYVNNPHIPEVWFASNVPPGQDHNDISPNGYTWLEEYLNGGGQSDAADAGPATDGGPGPDGGLGLDGGLDGGLGGGLDGGLNGDGGLPDGAVTGDSGPQCEVDEGCSCSLGSTDGPPAFGFLVAIGVAAFLRRRR